MHCWTLTPKKWILQASLALMTSKAPSGGLAGGLSEAQSNCQLCALGSATVVWLLLHSLLLCNMRGALPKKTQEGQLHAGGL